MKSANFSLTEGHERVPEPMDSVVGVYSALMFTVDLTTLYFVCLFYQSKLSGGQEVPLNLVTIALGSGWAGSGELICISSQCSQLSQLPNCSFAAADAPMICSRWSLLS